MGSDSGAIGVEVSGLHGTGRTISGRASGGEAAAKGLKDGLHTNIDHMEGMRSE